MKIEQQAQHVLKHYLFMNTIDVLIFGNYHLININENLLKLELILTWGGLMGESISLPKLYIDFFLYNFMIICFL